MQQVLQDRYRLTRHVARSGVADVYQGVDLTLDRRVALKVLRTEAARAPGVAEHFSHEATAATHLAHSNLGVVLYEAATGRAPFTADTPAELATLHLERMPLRPTAVNPAIPAGLERVLARLLAKDPAARYPNAEAVTADLLSVVDMPAEAA